jgi:hypothetical protein
VIHLSTVKAAQDVALVLESLVAAIREHGPAVGLERTAATSSPPDRNPPSSAPAAPGTDRSVAQPQPTDEVVSSVTILKYVVMGDRRFGEQERAAIGDAVGRFVRGDPAARNRASLLVNQIKPDPEAVVAAVRRLSSALDETGCASLLAATQRIAEADGRVTPKERERLAEIMARLREIGPRKA